MSNQGNQNCLGTVVPISLGSYSAGASGVQSPTVSLDTCYNDFYVAGDWAYCGGCLYVHASGPVTVVIGGFSVIVNYYQCNIYSTFDL